MYAATQRQGSGERQAVVTRCVPGTDQIARMQRDGFLVVPNFLDAAELSAVLEWTAELERAPGAFCPYHAGLDA